MDGFSLQIAREIPSINPNIVFEVFGFRIASSTLMSILIALIFALVGFVILRKSKAGEPSTFQLAMESIYESLVNLVGQLMPNPDRAKKIFPVIASLMIYLGIANIIGFIPGTTEWTINGKPLFQTPTADFNTAFGLSFAAIVALQFISIKEWGLWGHFNKYINIKGLVEGIKKKEFMVSVINFFVGMLDIVGEIARVVSLSLRLFGNIYAGSVLLVIFFGAIAYVAPVIWVGMSAFTGLLQAMVFGALIASYYSLTIKEENKPEAVKIKKERKH